jgi:ABC-type sugar transport system ATPase subunit
MATVQIENVQKKFGGVLALDAINLTIHDNEFVVLVGPSGSGKSTLLRIIAGLERETDGTVTINETNMAGVPPKNRDVAMVFQSHALYPHMSVYDNLAFNQRIRGVPRKEIDNKIKEVAERLEVTDLLKRRPRQMSGGQRQRVAIGRALVRDPQIFLFDEPLSNLDAELRVRLRTEIKRLHRELRRTSVYVTHDQVEAMTLADRVVVLRDGQIEQVGEPDLLYQRPSNTFVAGFIGSPAMNLMAVESTKGMLHIGGQTLPTTFEHEGSVTLGIRPEDILLETRETPETINAQITLIEPMGADTLIFCLIDGGQEISVRLPRHIRVGDGELLNLKPRPDSMHLFDPDSGRRLN